MHATKGNGIGSKTFEKGKNPNTFKAQVPNLKEILSRRGLLKKKTNPRGMLTRSLKECISIVMKWDIIPRIATNPS
jgi:hypothetical protein